MSVACGNPGLQDGGLVNQATITSSNIQGSVINGSAIEASSISKLTEIDEASAKVIASALADLDASSLSALAKALSELIPCVVPAMGPAHTEEEWLPTEMAGGRQYILGSPDGWLKMRGVVVPAYKEQA